MDGPPPRSSSLARLAASCATALDVLAFPLSCLVCGRDGLPEPFCEDCRLELIQAAGPSCPRCAMPVGPWADLAGGCIDCRDRRLGFDAALAVGPYQGPIRELCLKMKHKTEAWLVPWAAGIWIEANVEKLRDAGFDAVAPIPLHWAKRMRRGYDQADALARALAKRAGLKFVQPLRRVTPTPQLAGMGREARAKAMKDAFRARRGVDLSGRSVLLVDDVLTTGATAGAAARALKKAGAARVGVAVIARAEGKG